MPNICTPNLYLCTRFQILFYKTMKKQINTLETLKNLVILTAYSGEIMPEEVEPIAEKARAQLGLQTAIQAVLLSAFADMYDEEYISPSDIAEHFGVKRIEVLSVLNELDFFVKRRIILKFKDKDKRTVFRLAKGVMEALQKGHLPEDKQRSDLSIDELLEEVFDLVEANGKMKPGEGLFSMFVTSLLKNNQHLHLAQKLVEQNLDNDSLYFFFVMLKNMIIDNESSFSSEDLHYYYTDTFAQRRILGQLRSESFSLITNHIIEPSFNDGQASNDQWSFTEECVSDLLSEVEIAAEKDSKQGLILAEKIEQKELFYSDDIMRQINRLRKVMDKERMSDVLTALEKHQMRKCFTCIFYGAPGTGKTETVRQLARETGRDIMLVDIPSIRSKWVGVSEKNIKAIFTRYKKMANGRNDAPILLFNEADALLTCRNTSSSGSVDKMENAMQDIILQEMESLEGIMIATTNITSNLDKAFERRFLYKVEFEKPSAEARKNIWQSMIPELSDEVAGSLARKYDFSGGEIENIARKYLIDNIIDCDEADERLIFSLCEKERFNLKTIKSVGFNVK